jgi:hypothetical protein
MIEGGRVSYLIEYVGDRENALSGGLSIANAGLDRAYY